MRLAVLSEWETEEDACRVLVDMKSRRYPYTKQSLKRAVYGSNHPSSEAKRRRAIEEANRLASDLARLEEDFPGGFGTLARSVRSWR